MSSAPPLLRGRRTTQGFAHPEMSNNLAIGIPAEVAEALELDCFDPW
jgi:hypothetical protein